jgi:hypothetical protein
MPACGIDNQSDSIQVKQCVESRIVLLHLKSGYHFKITLATKGFPAKAIPGFAHFPSGHEQGQFCYC